VCSHVRTDIHQRSLRKKPSLSPLESPPNSGSTTSSGPAKPLNPNLAQTLTRSFDNLKFDNPLVSPSFVLLVICADGFGVGGGHRIRMLESLSLRTRGFRCLLVGRRRQALVQPLVSAIGTRLGLDVEKKVRLGFGYFSCCAMSVLGQLYGDLTL
jgi:hypothetical protein